MKHILTFSIIVALLIQGFGGYQLPVDSFLEEHSDKTVISEELMEEFASATSKSETYRVAIWMEDIDHDKVEQLAEKETGTTWEKLNEREDRIYANAVIEAASVKSINTERLLSAEEVEMVEIGNVFSLAKDELGMVQEDVNELIMAERKIAVKFYEEQNQILAENDIISENVQFVSRYAPMIIAELTQEQIEEIAKIETVVGVYELDGVESSYGDSKSANQEMEAVSNVPAVVPTSAYDYYLDYIGARSAHQSGITGKGVKVGLIDGQRVDNSAHSELNNSNIRTVGSEDIDDNHAIKMARVICGDYGVAPDCELYSVFAYSGSNGTGEFYTAIEMLLDQGVSVINMSYYYTRGNDGKYGEREMWFDHISTIHNVTIVKSAGNSTSDMLISSPGLAYNLITVANVEYKYNRVADTSCYKNEDGISKPDVASTGNYVLDFDSNGGTSAATATVSGMIALMLEVKPSLAGNPHLIKAIVIASANHIAGSSVYASTYNARQGAGVVNVVRALKIINSGQYYNNYVSSNGTITLNKSVASGTNTSTFVVVGNKMNTISGDHNKTSGVVDRNMPKLTLGIFNTSNAMSGYSDMEKSSVELVRCPYKSNVIIRISVSEIGNLGMEYALAWY